MKAHLNLSKEQKEAHEASMRDIYKDWWFKNKDQCYRITLWTLMHFYGWKHDRLEKFWKQWMTVNEAMMSYYSDASIKDFPADEELKKIGVRIEDFAEEEDLVRNREFRFIKFKNGAGLTKEIKRLFIQWMIVHQYDADKVVLLTLHKYYGWGAVRLKRYWITMQGIREAADEAHDGNDFNMPLDDMLSWDLGEVDINIEAMMNKFGFGGELYYFDNTEGDKKDLKEFWI